MKLTSWSAVFCCLFFAVETFGQYQTGLNGEFLNESESQTYKQTNTFHNSDVVWAVNVGGKDYIGLDGIYYKAEQYVSGGIRGEIDKILGSQDSVLYQSYREGDVAIDYPLENGEYNIVFHFAEPFDIDMDGRLFDVIAQDELVINDLNVRLARDGKHKSGLVTAVSNVKVTDGRLKIRFEATTGKPILSALVVRKTNDDTRKWNLIWYDEFEGNSLDESKWSIDVWPAFKVNSEDQAYTARAKNIRLADGKLIIEAHKEDFEGAAYTSGRIHSKGKGDFLYGKADIRAKLP